MKQSECDQLDDYLLGWFSADEASAFERHLLECPSCRQEQELQRQIDGVFAGGDRLLDPIPEGLVARTRAKVRAVRRRRVRRWALAVAASVLALVAIGRVVANYGCWPVDEQVAATEEAERPESRAPPEAPASLHEPAAAPARIAMTDPSTGIVVDLKTKDPRITFVWVYPTVQPESGAGEDADN